MQDRQKIKLYLYGLIGILLFAIILLISINSFLVYPKIRSLLTAYLETSAKNIAHHHKSMYFKNSEDEIKLEITDSIIKKIKSDIDEFGIMKIKIYSNDGIVLFSSDTSEIGSKTTASEFFNIVANNKIYSELVKKGFKSAEGAQFDRDVFEVYTPINTKNGFIGAFEIYFDMTDTLKNLNHIILISNIAALLIILISMPLILVILKKAVIIISKLIDTEEKLKNAKERAEESSRIKSEFLANMSHEIRTPMNSITGFTQVLKENETDNEKREIIDIIHQSGSLLLNLINDILDFSKIEHGKIEIIKKDFDFHKFAEHIRKMFYLRAEDAGLEFNFTVSNNFPKVVYGDEHRISQIFNNLLGNAFKFTSKGSITFSAMYSDGSAIFIFRDSGIGIPQEKIDKVFDAFEQAETSINRKYGGAGLGLAITKKIVELMEGEITVKSDKNLGTEFTVVIPLAISENSTAFESSESQTPSLISNTADYVSSIHTKSVKDELMVQRWFDANPDLKSIIIKAIEMLPGNLNKLSDAISRNISKDIKFIAHDIKGSYGNLGMTEIYKIAKEICDEARKENYSIDFIDEKYKELRTITTRIPDKYLHLPELKNLFPEELKSEYSGSNKILIVDDNPNNLKLLNLFLKELFIEINIAENGAVALEMLKKNKYQLILLDMQMPVMDGYETVKIIRANEDLADIYVIAMTAFAMKGDAEKCIEAGCSDYLPKPIDKNLLIAKITSLLHICSKIPLDYSI
ncbi:MAG: Hpt sensor hybrid histidine kinase [Parcubacteria group bacterium GW2011_GWF2_50_9]|nr:MAG: Hpt sensor hybrid histidine kinase [Parcubacteria group bacterium GW2011_GWF2_50_9]